MTDTILAIDVSLSGISGDMFLAALINLSDKINSSTEILETIDLFVNQLECKINTKVDISTEDIVEDGFKGIHLNLTGFDTRIETPQIDELIQYLLESNSVDAKYMQVAKTMLEILIEAEKKVHSTDHPHLHELGTLDTVLDIALTVILLNNLGIDAIILSPVALGQGIVNTAHGKLHVPAPATTEIMQMYQLMTVPGPQGGEATTPTGMAILASLSTHFPTVNSVIYSHFGRGFGSKKWVDRSNNLRVRLGVSSNTPSLVTILETNIDDVSAEILGYTVEQLIQKGALDVSYYPIFMKKNRPAYCLRVIVRTSEIEFIADEIQKLTGTLGIRVFDISRHIGERTIEEKIIEIDGEKIKYRLKKGKYHSKVEFEDLKLISEKYNIPINQLKMRLELED